MHRNTLYQLNKLLVLIKQMKNDGKKFGRIRDLNRGHQNYNVPSPAATNTTTKHWRQSADIVLSPFAPV